MLTSLRLNLLNRIGFDRFFWVVGPEIDLSTMLSRHCLFEVLGKKKWM